MKTKEQIERTLNDAMTVGQGIRSMKYTPGPWKLGYSQDATLHPHDGSLGGMSTTVQQINADGRTIHTVCWAQYYHDNDIDAVEVCANGKLIAAAPDMLDALERVERALVAIKPYCYQAESEVPCVTALQAARTAIAKATGV